MITKTREAMERTGKPPLAPRATEVLLESLEKVKALEFDATGVIDRIAPRALSIITTKDDDADPIEQIVEAYERALLSDVLESARFTGRGPRYDGGRDALER
jgi:hypothetical protein